MARRAIVVTTGAYAFGLRPPSELGGKVSGARTLFAEIFGGKYFWGDIATREG